MGEDSGKYDDDGYERAMKLTGQVSPGSLSSQTGSDLKLADLLMEFDIIDNILAGKKLNAPLQAKSGKSKSVAYMRPNKVISPRAKPVKVTTAKTALISPLKFTLKPYQIDELKRISEMLENDDRLIPIDYVTTFLRACGSEPTSDDVQQLLSKVKPCTKDFLYPKNVIEVFLAYLEMRDPIDKIKRAFKHFDYESDGVVTIDNLRTISQLVGFDLHDEELEEMIKAANKSGTGGVTMDEFVKFFRNVEYYDLVPGKP